MTLKFGILPSDISTAQTKIVKHSPKNLINHEWKKYSFEQKVHFIHPLLATLGNCSFKIQWIKSQRKESLPYIYYKFPTKIVTRATNILAGRNANLPLD